MFIALENVIIVVELGRQAEINLKPIISWQTISIQKKLLGDKKKYNFGYCTAMVPKFGNNLTTANWVLSINIIKIWEKTQGLNNTWITESGCLKWNKK